LLGLATIGATLLGGSWCRCYWGTHQAGGTQTRYN